MKLSESRVHRTAIIDARVELADDVVVEPYAILQGDIRLGAGCHIGAGVQLIGPLVMGRDNHIGARTVIGERPQHLGYAGESTGVTIGDGNCFAEHVTVHGGIRPARPTSIGNANRFASSSHVAHDCTVGSFCRLHEQTLLAGHCLLEDGVRIRRGSAVHQFCRLGRLACLGDSSMTTKDIPPFVVQRGVNRVVGIRKSLRSGGLDASAITALRRLFRIMYRCGLSVPSGLSVAEAELGTIDVVREYLRFVRESPRGINLAAAVTPA